ncbi:hypothetical protein [Burkholderia sp. Ac-20379]|uniref:hypothetical protein n=1 Tax=Burkholderia sp. Ac-20379 TaxID=2703900 RepID=UPI00197DB450|nr:hypothetical protein [Burkholderia sp. Ac-20379]MBN3724477.1 hypothetical protein [Burkholderia sp. Ac-20379]
MDVRRTGANTPATRSDQDRQPENGQRAAPNAAPVSQVIGGPLQDLTRRRMQENAESGRGMIETDSRLRASPSVFQSLDSAMTNLSLDARPTRPAQSAPPAPPRAPGGNTRRAPLPRAPQPRTHAAPPSADPRRQLFDGMAEPNWRDHLFQGFDAVMNASPASLNLGPTAPSSAVLSRGDQRSAAEQAHTASIHQARPSLGLDDLQTDRQSLGRGTPEQVAQGRTYIPRLAQAETLIRTYFGHDGEHRDERALPPFRSLAQEIGADAASEHDAEQLSAGDYLKIMDHIGVMFRRVPDDD